MMRTPKPNVSMRADTESERAQSDNIRSKRWE